MKPLIYLELRTLVNSFRYATRSPKRLLPLVIFVGWILISIVQSIMFMGGISGEGKPDLSLLVRIPEVTEPMLAILLVLGSAAVLWNAFSSGLMVFSLSQIDFLFALPVSQRIVLVIKLIKDYVKYGAGVAFLYIVFGSMIFGALEVGLLPWGLVSIAALTALIIFVVNLAHTLNIIFTFGFERLSGLGRIAKILIVGVPGAAIIYLTAAYLAGDRSLAAANAPLMALLFAPAQWCASLLLAPLKGIMIPEDLVKLGLLWVLAAASFAALISRKENIYEPSLGISVKFARRRAAMRGGDQSGLVLDALRERGTHRLRWSTLPPFGRRASAFVWKNLLVKLRMSRSQIPFLVLLPVFIVYMISLTLPKAEFTRHLPLALLYAVWIMSLMTQGEMRSDLRYANVVKPVPVAAWKLMLAQTLSATVFITAAGAVFASAMLALMPQTRTPIAAATLAGTPFLTFATVPAVLIPAILYPDIRDVVQNYLCGILSLVLASAALLPAAVTGAVLILALRAPLLVAVPVAGLACLGTGAVGVALAGLAFEKFEPTGE